jgi:predicted DNA-binding transcriptional regulator AlpA
MQVVAEIASIEKMTSPQAKAELAKIASIMPMLIAKAFETSPALEPTADRLLGATEAAAMLSLAPTTLYKNAGEYPFTVRLGRSLRFSLRGLEQYIARRRAA